MAMGNKRFLGDRIVLVYLVLCLWEKHNQIRPLLFNDWRYNNKTYKMT